MKTIFSLLLTLATASSALAQGKVNFINDSLHLIYFTTDTSWLPAGDAALAGQVYAFGEGGQSLTVELWAGTSSTSLALQSTTDFTGQSALGKWNSRTVTFASIPAGPIWATVDIYDSAAGSYLNATRTIGHIIGTSGLFMMNASGTIAYNSIVNHNSPADSTWTDGTYDLGSQVGVPGARGAIILTFSFPEPSTFALSCLGLGLLLMRRRSETKRAE